LMKLGHISTFDIRAREPGPLQGAA